MPTRDLLAEIQGAIDILPEPRRGAFIDALWNTIDLFSTKEQREEIRQYVYGSKSVK